MIVSKPGLQKYFLCSLSFDGQLFTELEIRFDQLEYFFTEGVTSVPEPIFTLILCTVSHREAVARFQVENFIVDLPQMEAEEATGWIN